MRWYRDLNTGEVYTESELREHFERLKEAEPEEYDYDFETFLGSVENMECSIEEILLGGEVALCKGKSDCHTQR